MTDRHALWKWLLLAGLTAWSLAVVLPLDKKVRLGLDLRGGTSFTVEMDEAEIKKQIRDQSPDLTDAQMPGQLAKAVKRAQEQSLEIIRNRVDALGVAEPMIYPEKNNRVVVQIPGLKEADRDRARDLIQSAAFLAFSMVHESNDKLVASLFEKGLAPRGFRIVTVDAQGRKRSLYRRDKDIVPDEAFNRDFRETLKTFQAPTGFQFMPKSEFVDGAEFYEPYFVRQRYEMRGDTIKSAGYQYDQMGRLYVKLEFDSKGTRQFTRITKDYAPGGERNPSPDGRRYMAIILDGTLYSAPFIKTAIYGGEAVIEGDFTLQEAQNLAIALRAGSLPVPVRIVESRSVDPTLGRDSIESGVRATIYACISVVVFMTAYYLLAGVVADIGMLFSILLLPLGMMIAAGVMSIFAGDITSSGKGMIMPVLTLPGIAGIALTIGMAVDANVLIFERIREEQALGKRLGASVDAGYHKAFVTIVDANLTTIISAIILFIFGTGPVRGFGVTLTAGILVSMYTALVVTRMIFNAITSINPNASLKMLSILKSAKVDFIGIRKGAFIFSMALILGTWAFMFVRGASDPGAVLGTDFTGGTAITFSLTEKPDVEEVRNALNAAGVSDAHIQYQKELDKSAEFLLVRVAFDAGDKAKESLASAFDGLMVLSEDSVGPQVGMEMTKRAATALLLAILGMILYISIRFEFAFALGAIVALVHDVLVCVGIYCMVGRQINMPILAALLAIIGYSVNDTIVIFDRIRENTQRYRDKSFVELCNLSINETLSRTILTSMTTFLAVMLLFIFGGGAINDFALVFVIGVIIGTYSTIFIATPTVLLLRHKKPAPTGAPKR